MGGLGASICLLGLAAAPAIVRLPAGAMILDAGEADGYRPGDGVEVDREVEVDLPDRGLRALRPLGEAALEVVGFDLSLGRPPPGVRLGDLAHLVRRRISAKAAFPPRPPRGAAFRPPFPSRAPASPPG
ncbi:MAG: hypothetical protein ACYDCL_13875 [Myxococcales bacterium]